jgi:e3 binding domain
MSSVLVPWRGGDRFREQAWRWVWCRWLNAGFVPQDCAPPPGPWCKAAALMPHVADADEIVVLGDADAWTTGIADAISAVESGADWAVPHLKVHRLTKTASGDLLYGLMQEADGESIWTLDTEERPYNGMVGGGIIVVRRDVLLQVPLDRRFVGWGREDCAWREAMLTLVGEPWRGTAPLVHLWHPPQPRPNRAEGSRPTEELFARYRAARDKPDQMRDLLAEIDSAAPVTQPEEIYVYRYQNENTGQIVESETPKQRFEALPNWRRLDGEAPTVPSAGDEGGPDLQAYVAALGDEHLARLAVLALAEVKGRGLDEDFFEAVAEGDPQFTEILEALNEEDAFDEGQEEDPEASAQESAKEEKCEPAGQTEIQATAAAVELAEAESIDLRTLTGTGDDGRIVIDDVRKAVDTKGGDAA